MRVAGGRGVDAQDLLDVRQSWGPLILLAIALLIIGELGYWGGRWQRGDSLEAKKAQTSVHVGALLALLGLMLAFSFSIVEARFSALKALALEEANAIGTCYLRAEMLPAPYGRRIQDLLRDYVKVRIGHDTPARLQRAIEQSEAFHSRLWAQATAVAKANPESEIAGIFVQSLNPVLDLHEARVTVELHQRLPRAILVMLYVVAGLAFGVLGYSAGLGRVRALLPTVALALAITAVLSLIVDLDNPNGHLFRVNEAAMQDLQETMSRDYSLRAPEAAPGRLPTR